MKLSNKTQNQQPLINLNKLILNKYKHNNQQGKLKFYNHYKKYKPNCQIFNL